MLHVANLQPLRVSRRVNLLVLNKDKNENNIINNNHYYNSDNITNNNFVSKRSSGSVTTSNKGPTLFHA